MSQSDLSSTQRITGETVTGMPRPRDTAPDPARPLRRAVYGILIAASIGMVVGRILAVNSTDRIGAENRTVQEAVDKYKAQLTDEGKTWTQDELDAVASETRRTKTQQRPFLSANDRSRWATVRSLVEQGTYQIDDIVSQPLWDTIDMVQHQGPDGKPHRYSSKPPLLATMLAGPYWVIYKTTGATLGTHPFEIGRAMLIVINGLTLLVYFLALASLAERFGESDWGRIFMMAAAAFGTFLTTFAVSLNNHLLAAACVAVVMWSAAKLWFDGERRLRWFALCGLAAGFAFSFELPCLALLGLVGLALLVKAPRQTLLGFAPGVLVVLAAHFGTIYAAHDSLREPYAHRSETDASDNWYRFTYAKQKSDGTEEVKTSYWSDPKGIDKGDPLPGHYALHVLIGHHGIFSLTPIWLLTFLGIAVACRRPQWRATIALAAILTAVCLGFYLSRPQIDRNFGGMTSGLRWMFWFAPLWLVCMLPAADKFASSRLGRGFALVLLALSAMSASYPTWNPWTQPWIANFMLHMEWLKF